MTKRVQNHILYQLHFLKSIGYEYRNNIKISNIQEEHIKLPNDLTSLKTVVDNCYLCQLSKYRENVLFGSGNKNSNLIFIGDAPGITEDEIGEFFVGRAGSLLVTMIEKSLELNIEDVYITNIVKCISSNGVVNIQEANTCRAYLDKQIDLIKPKIIILLGEVAYQYMTNDNAEFSKIRGKIFKYNGITTMCTYEPNFLLRNPSSKKEAYQDMLKIKSLMERM